MYEVFFEVSLCLMINFTVIDMTKADLSLNWILTMVLSVLALLSLLLLSYLCCRNGPYIKGTYERNSVWHFHSIKPEILNKMIKIESDSD